MVALARSLFREEGLDEDRRRAVGDWPRYDARCEQLRREVREWPARADAVLADRTGLGKNLWPMLRWRDRAEPLLAEARAMLAEGSPHAPHLAAMPDECKALVETAGQIENALPEIETAQADHLQKILGHRAVLHSVAPPRHHAVGRSDDRQPRARMTGAISVPLCPS